MICDKGTGLPKLILRTASMFLKGIVKAKRYSNWDLKSSKICFLRKFGICN